MWARWSDRETSFLDNGGYVAERAVVEAVGGVMVEGERWGLYRGIGMDNLDHHNLFPYVHKSYDTPETHKLRTQAPPLAPPKCRPKNCTLRHRTRGKQVRPPKETTRQKTFKQPRASVARKDRNGVQASSRVI